MPIPALWVSVGNVIVVMKEILIILTIAHASIMQSINGLQNSKHVPTGRSLKREKLDNSCSCCFRHYLFTVVGISLFEFSKKISCQDSRYLMTSL
jgi:hypothetical protein